MKRITALSLALLLMIGLAACGSSATTPPETQIAEAVDPPVAERTKVKIGITGESENVIWAPVIAEVEKEGIDIEIVNFADYTLVNGALSDGDIDLNAFQHHAYLNNQIAEYNYAITDIGETYISAMCVYSVNIKNIGELKPGDKIAIPNDTVNLGRALSVAQGAGIITLSGPANGDVYETTDIATNPLNIEFVQVDAAQIPALLPDVAVGVINGNYALDYGLSPTDDAIFYDDVSFYPDNRYANTIVARAADANNPVFAKIVAAYQSSAVEQVYKDAFEGSYIPAWKSAEPQAPPAPVERAKVKIGITGESENVIWAPVIAEVEKEGIDIEIVNFADYTLVNGALSDGDIDLNAFQHHAYLNNQIDEYNYAITAIGDTYISAMCVYSTNIKDVNEIKDGDKIAIPNDTVNLGRALSVAQGAGLITLNDPANGNVYEISDVATNPLNLEFVQVDAAQIPALLPDVAAGIINGNYALDFGLSPTNDAIFYDDVSFYPDNRYANTIVARAADATNPVFLKIVKAYQSSAVEQVYKDAFEGSYLPAWK